MRYRNDYKFIAKLPFTTHSLIKYQLVGVEGIVKGIYQYLNNTRVYGYIHYVIIQPELIDNSELKIVCFNGRREFMNLVKVGKNGRSPFGLRSKQRKGLLFQFAEHVIAKLRISCPELMSTQVLRIDVVGFTAFPGEFIVNEVEGFEAQKTSTGLGGHAQICRVISKTEEQWFSMFVQLIDHHLSHCVN